MFAKVLKRIPGVRLPPDRVNTLNVTNTVMLMTLRESKLLNSFIIILAKINHISCLKQKSHIILNQRFIPTFLFLKLVD